MWQATPLLLDGAMTKFSDSYSIQLIYYACQSPTLENEMEMASKVGKGLDY